MLDLQFMEEELIDKNKKPLQHFINSQLIKKSLKKKLQFGLSFKLFCLQGKKNKVCKRGAYYAYFLTG